MSSNCYLFISYNLQVPFWLCEQRVASQNNCSVKPFIGKWTHVASRIGAKSSPPHLLYWLWFHVLLLQDNSMTKPCWLRLTHGTLASSHNNGGNLLQEASQVVVHSQLSEISIDVDHLSTRVTVSFQLMHIFQIPQTLFYCEQRKVHQALQWSSANSVRPYCSCFGIGIPLLL